jgi:hypothetical protein
LTFRLEVDAGIGQDVEADELLISGRFPVHVKLLARVGPEETAKLPPQRLVGSAG